MRIPGALLVTAALGLAALGGAAAAVVAPHGPSKQSVTITEREFRITLPRTSVKPGVVRLVARNNGRYAHSLAIRGRGLATRKTPLIDPGRTAALVVKLAAGSYSIWCPVPGHAAQGMRATLVVGGAASPPTTAQTTTGSEDPPITPGY